MGELYSNTDIDELVLNACAEQCASQIQTSQRFTIARLHDCTIVRLHHRLIATSPLLIIATSHHRLARVRLFSNDRPFSPDDQQWLLMLERLLLARPGVINSVLQG